MSASSLPTVAIVILTWNQRDLTLDCLDSLAAIDYPADRLQVIVVDNGSSDGTPAAVHQRFPSVVVLENGDNLGFAEGNNVGLRHVLAGSAEHVMLLNNDTIVDSGMLSDLVAVFQAQADVGIVGPKMLYYDPPDVIWCAGNQLGRRPWISRRLQAGEHDSMQPEPPRDVDYITGCAILLRREVIEQIGLLDDRFFIYYEETDWCLRAQAAGWRTVYVPAARLWHRVSAAMGSTSPATDYYMSRNVYLFVAKNRRGVRKLVDLPAIVVRQVAAIAAYSVKSHGGERTRNRNARIMALRDAIAGRWGKMGPDVNAVCYPAKR